MVALMLISKWEEFALGAGAILILVMGTFGLDSIVFRKKRAYKRDPRAPKQRISFVVVDEPTEAEPTEPERLRR
jgi:hypothetical protein